MKDKAISGLLIEDDPDDTMLLLDLMAQSDWPSFKFTFACAENLKTGLKLLAEGGVEVVLLDLMLPDSQGIETVSRVQAQAPDIPIVVLTGLNDEALGLKAVMQGAQDYQVKGSISGHALKRTVSYAVERHRLLARLQDIIKSAPDGMVIVDSKKTMIRYANPAAEALLGRTAEDLLGKPFHYPMSSARSGELKIVVKGGGERTLEMRVAEIEWQEESASLISMRDITELRRIEQLKAEIFERRKMDKLKDELMSAVSHEMRSPLTIIKAAGNNLKEGLAGSLSTHQAKMVSLQHKNILRLEKIVDHILDLSRLESGKAQINVRRINGIQLIRDAVRGFRLVAGERNLMIQQEISHDLPCLYADPELFIQVLSNLIDNAMRFAETRVLIRAGALERAPIGGEAATTQLPPTENSPPRWGRIPAALPVGEGGGSVGGGPEQLQEASKSAHAGRDVAVLTARKYVQISVIDDGQGIPKERIGDLFNKFVQVNRSSRGEGYRGTGLGLAICKEIIERQNGRIWAESALGQGARFHFLLPQCESGPTGEQGGAYVGG